MAEAISDEKIIWVLSRYAGLAAKLLDEPQTWAEVSDAPAGRLSRLGRGVRTRFTGDVHPGSDEWRRLAVADRVDWWADRVAAIAAPVAATPRIFGLVADRLPLQAAFGAAAQGLVVCATALEHGRTDPDSWVPLLGRVLLDRKLPTGRTAEALADDAQDLQDPEGGAVDLPEQAQGRLRRGGVAIWRLARALLALHGMFDGRPRGSFAFRALGKVPVVGLLGGVLDERGGVRRAAQETTELLRAADAA